MSDTEAERKLTIIEKALSSAGYTARDQLFGYYITGDETLITRKGKARDMIRGITSDQIEAYLKKRYPELKL